MGNSAAAARATKRLGQALLVLFPVAFSALVYYPITKNYFYADDFLNLYRIANTQLLEYLVMPHGGHVLLVRNAIFYLFAQAFKTEPAYYFWAVLLTHLVNVYLLFQVIRFFTRSTYLACFGAVLWGASPLNEGSLGWYSVYGQVLVATAFLVILYQLGRAAGDNTPPPRHAALLWYILALAASTSFGVGIALAMTLPVVIMLLLPGWRARFKGPAPLISLLVVVPALYFGLHYLSTALSGPTLPVGDMIKAYLISWQVILPTLFNLVTYGLSHLVFGFFYTPSDYPGVGSYTVVGLFLAACLTAVLRAPATVRRQLIACTVMVLSCYGIIAIGRSSLFYELGLAGMETSPRYHYVGLIPLALMLCILLNRLSFQSGISSAAKNVLFLVWLGVTLFGYIHAGPTIDHRDKVRLETEHAVATMQSAIHQRPRGETVYISNRPFRSLASVAPPHVFPGWAALFMAFYPDNTVDGRRVYFISNDPKVNQAAKKGRRSTDLFVDARPAR